MRNLHSFPTRRSSDLEEEYIEEVVEPAFEVPDINVSEENEVEMRRKQLEKLVEEKPEDFAKLLRSWLSDEDRKSTRLNSSHVAISYAVFCLKKKTKTK